MTECSADKWVDSVLDEAMKMTFSQRNALAEDNGFCPSVLRHWVSKRKRGHNIDPVLSLVVKMSNAYNVHIVKWSK